MRYLLFAALAMLPALHAQIPINMAVESIVLEPSPGLAGPYLSRLRLPDGSSIAARSEPGFESREFYALPGRSTRSLCVVTNRTSEDLIADLDFNVPSGGALTLLGWRRFGTPISTMKPGFPDKHAVWMIYGVDKQFAVVPAGESVPLFLLFTLWSEAFWSPFDFTLTFVVNDVITGQPYAFEADLKGPPPSIGNPACAVLPGSGAPAGLAAVFAATCALARRRRRHPRRSR
jgi:hypothetical protein